MVQPELCTYLEFSKRHNFTLVDSSLHRDLVNNNLLADFTMEETALDLPLLYGDKSKAWVFFYLLTKPFHMIVVLDTNEISETNQRALLMSMDESTWIMTLISMTTLSFTLHYLRIISKESSGLLGILISVFGTFINQGMNLPKIKLSLFLTFGIWSLVTIVITNGYAGLLFALLTKPTVPDVPNDLAGLLNNSFQFDMVSFTTNIGHRFSSSMDIHWTELAFVGTVERFRDAEVAVGKKCPICDGILKKFQFSSSALPQYRSTPRKIVGNLIAI